MRTLFLMTTAVLAVALSTPASADGTPECNNGSGGGSTECGTGSLTFLDRTTAVGAQARATLEGATALGDAASAISNLYSLFDSGFTVPAVGSIGSTAIGAITQTYASDSVAIGAYSTIGDIHGPLDQAFLDGDVLIGTDSLLIANRSTVLGAHSSVTGDDSVVIGYGATSAYSNTVNLGSGNMVGSVGATAIGTGQSATGAGAVAIGDPNVATGTGAVAIGADNSAVGNGAVAVGNANQATGAGSVAVGQSSIASTAGSVALGAGASVTGANSVAIGSGSVASQANTVSVGSAGSSRRIVNVADGVDAGDAVNVGQLNAATAQLQSNDSMLFDLADRNHRDIRDADEGVAMALAMDSPNIPDGAHFAVSGGVGYFKGRAAFAAALSAAVGAMSSVSAGVGYGFNSKKVGARAGFQVGF